MADKGKSAADIAKEMSVPPKVAVDAAKIPLRGSGKEAKEAAEWHGSVYGAKRAHRNKTLRSLGPLGKALVTSRTAYKNAVQDLHASLTDPSAFDLVQAGKIVVALATQAAYEKAKAAYKKGYQDYRNLPEEKDAWKVGGRVRARYAGRET